MTGTFELKKALLKALYEAYDESVAGFDTACVPDCSSCCTHNVLAATVEVQHIMEYCEQSGRQRLLTPLLDAGQGRRLRPQLTINTLADYCLRREEPPLSEDDFDMAPCPLRGDSGCPIYEVRPFACRAMWSVESCHISGEAVMPPELVTLNGVFEQMIEHVDSGGLCGNLIDLIKLLDDPDTRNAYLNGEALQPAIGMPAGRANPGFLVPPAHRPRVRKVMEILDRKSIQGVPFRDALRSVRNDQS